MVLSFGKSWTSARPVAFDSMTFKGAKLNYPVHEKELLAIIRALKKWRVDLLGSPFFIYTDHKTLQNFNTQKDLSRRQARWMELMSQYDAKIVYVKGGDNTVADALSRLPCQATSESAENVARHPYSYCDDDDDVSRTIACIWSTKSVGPRESAKALSHCQELSSINTTLNISADKYLLQEIKDGYANDT